MIAMHLQGRLGNIMFQTATLEYMGKRFGYETCYPNIRQYLSVLEHGNVSYINTPHAQEYLKIFKNFSWTKNEDKSPEINTLIKIPFKFEHIREVDDKTKFMGYFQSEENWGGEREFVQKLFEPSEFVTSQLEKYKGLFIDITCFIHVRRGDYLKYPDVHPTVTVDYINRAKKELEGHEIKKYLVFSDDIPWCKENLKGDDHVFIEGEKDYVELFLMGQCEYKIIANSSFSWFGSYLSPKGGVTVAPKVWIKSPRIDDSHVCPWFWTRI